MAKFEVGDKVKVIDDLKATSYDGVGVALKMLEFAGQTMTIESVSASGAGVKDATKYKLKEDSGHWNWTDSMLEPLKKTSVTRKSKTVNEAIDLLSIATNENSKKFDDVTATLEKLIDKVNERTIYDDAMQKSVLDKVKDISLDDIKKDLTDYLKAYIKENYNVLPKKIEIHNEKSTKRIDGLFHKEFENILKVVSANVPLMLTGGAGAGKNHTLEQVAQALGLDFYFTNAVTQEYKLTGFIDANGNYNETQFYKAFKDGGLFFLDEIDASSPDALIILNSAIANRYFDFPVGRIDANENFRVVCAGNTTGNGASAIYVGRNALDGATLDRFITINFDYDENIEKSLAYDIELYDFIKKLRDTVSANSMRYIVSMRATINATKLLRAGLDKDFILRDVIVKSMSQDDLNILKPSFENDSNEWACILMKL